MPLTPKQQRFVSEYLIDCNATRAATDAGYSAKTASSQGERLLRNVEIAAAIAAGQARVLEKAELSAERVLEELRRLAFLDPRKFFDPATGKLRKVTELDDDTAAALGQFDVIIANAQAGDGITDTIHRIKTIDKTRALELLAKHFALLVERVQVSGDADLVARLTAARKRTEASRGDAGDE